MVQKGEYGREAPVLIAASRTLALADGALQIYAEKKEQTSVGDQF